ncbi:P1 family peptidase [Pacificimonas sp. WHA3]|uniref:P1 family peptidase n=1 Tax=Pacificimonas pallii TaxID=2827236 RepID=A0ABS6SA73_9SPHN|nr:P1 family peptidase [Pacificimonas pallii]MBV7255293.1 P1 family peptidase [Pacificimonas pallii]
MNKDIWRKIATAIAGTALIAFGHVPVAAQSDGATPQSALELTINDGFEGKDAFHFDWPEIRVGTGQYEAGPTGATVIHFPKRAHVAMDARGGGPGTINSDYIALGYPAAELDAIVLAGGTFYGLETATAVNTALIDDRKRSGRWDNIGVVMGSIIYDMGGRRLNEIYPDKRLAQAALRAAKPGIFPRGAYGAGRSAIAGGMFGCNTNSGQGAAFRQIGDIKIAAFTVVNALGVITSRDGKVLGCYKNPGWPEELTPQHLLGASPASMDGDWNGTDMAAAEKRNTTISVIVTNRAMNPAELKRLAVQVHTSMARAIQPFATEYDGDVLYAVSTGEIESGPGTGLVTAEIGTIAGEVMWDAILSAVPEQSRHLTPQNEPKLTNDEIRTAIGAYRFGTDHSLRVWHDGGQIYAQSRGPHPVFAIAADTPTQLLSVGKGLFTVPGRYPFAIQFSKDQAVINPGRWAQIGKRTGG